MRSHFQPSGYLEIEVKMLERRMLQQNESIHDCYNDTMRVYGISQNLDKNYTKEFTATKLANGLTGQLSEDVKLMDPTLPTGIRVPTAYSTNRDTLMPYDMTSAPELTVDNDY